MELKEKIKNSVIKYVSTVFYRLQENGLQDIANINIRTENANIFQLAYSLRAL